MPIFAYAIEPHYTIVQLPFKQFFTPGKSDWWKVRLLKHGKVVTESGRGWFNFKEP